jgi:predicted dithiol-disulfide oxidoreductase (DUF899 family)
MDARTFADAEKELDLQEQRVRAETEKLLQMHRERKPQAVKDYTFKTPSKTVTLSQLFGDKKQLIVIQNMGADCPYCTLWADGFTGFARHFESYAGFALVNGDTPEAQEKFAKSRGWNYTAVSSHGTSFFQDMGFQDEKDGTPQPGVSIFTKNEKGEIFRSTRAYFGPGDLFCSIWNFFGMLPGFKSDESWQPSYKNSPNT